MYSQKISARQRLSFKTDWIFTCFHPGVPFCFLTMWCYNSHNNSYMWSPVIMMTSWHGNTLLLALHEGNPLVTREFPHKGPVMWNFDAFCIVSLVIVWTNSQIVSHFRWHEAYVTPLYWWHGAEYQNIAHSTAVVRLNNRRSYMELTDEWTDGWTDRFRSLLLLKPMMFRANSRLAPSQWGMSLQRNAISHWLGTTLESADDVNSSPVTIMTTLTENVLLPERSS